jgi:hypothetical protein
MLWIVCSPNAYLYHCKQWSRWSTYTWTTWKPVYTDGKLQTKHTLLWLCKCSKSEVLGREWFGYVWGYIQVNGIGRSIQGTSAVSATIYFFIKRMISDKYVKILISIRFGWCWIWLKVFSEIHHNLNRDVVSE